MRQKHNFWQNSVCSENKFTPKDKIFYTDNIRASVTNSMSAGLLISPWLLSHPGFLHHPDFFSHTGVLSHFFLPNPGYLSYPDFLPHPGFLPHLFSAVEVISVSSWQSSLKSPHPTSWHSLVSPLANCHPWHDIPSVLLSPGLVAVTVSCQSSYKYHPHTQCQQVRVKLSLTFTLRDSVTLSLTLTLRLSVTNDTVSHLGLTDDC